MDNRMKSAVIGGSVAGVLSIIPVLGTCCCLWAIGGGVLAVYLYLKDARVPMTPADGATLGAVAGGIAAAISLIIGLPVAIMFGAAAMTDAFQRANVRIPFTGMALMVVTTLIRAVIILALAALGGLIGAAIFGKQGPGGAGVPPPPPPAGGYDGGVGGSVGGGGGFGS
jgi:Na+/proline symporter